MVGRRSYQSTLALFRNIAERANPEDIALITHLELLRCYYNFVRPHQALKFGREISDTGQAGGIDRKAPNVTRDLLVGIGLPRMVRDARVRLL